MVFNIFTRLCKLHYLVPEKNFKNLNDFSWGMPSSYQAPPLPIVLHLSTASIYMATWPRRHLNLLPGLRELFFLVSLILEANAKITLWILVWGILVVSWRASIFPPLFLFQLCHLNSFKTGPHLCCSLLWEMTSHCPQEGFLRIHFKLLFLVYKSLYDPLPIRLTFLSVS